jgi:hypothetical protein
VIILLSERFWPRYTREPLPGRRAPPPDLCGTWKVLVWSPNQRWYLVSVTVITFLTINGTLSTNTLTFTSQLTSPPPTLIYKPLQNVALATQASLPRTICYQHACQIRRSPESLTARRLPGHIRARGWLNWQQIRLNKEVVEVIAAGTEHETHLPLRQVALDDDVLLHCHTSP